LAFAESSNPKVRPAAHFRTNMFMWTSAPKSCTPTLWIDSFTRLLIFCLQYSQQCHQFKSVDTSVAGPISALLPSPPQQPILPSVKRVSPSPPPDPSTFVSNPTFFQYPLFMLLLICRESTVERRPSLSIHSSSQQPRPSSALDRHAEPAIPPPVVSIARRLKQYSTLSNTVSSINEQQQHISGGCGAGRKQQLLLRTTIEEMPEPEEQQQQPPMERGKPQLQHKETKQRQQQQQAQTTTSERRGTVSSSRRSRSESTSSESSTDTYNRVCFIQDSWCLMIFKKIQSKKWRHQTTKSQSAAATSAAKEHSGRHANPAAAADSVQQSSSSTHQRKRQKQWKAQPKEVKYSWERKHRSHRSTERRRTTAQRPLERGSHKSRESSSRRRPKAHESSSRGSRRAAVEQSPAPVERHARQYHKSKLDSKGSSRRRSSDVARGGGRYMQQQKDAAAIRAGLVLIVTSNCHSNSTIW
jgi:hypothetical protein